MVQHIRRTQFITTYGPGAILEGPRGPRIIPSPDIGLFYSNIRPEDFEITDDRVSRGLLGGRKIFRLPSNAELNCEDSRAVYRTKVFPEWWICSEHSILFRYRTGCPRCREELISGGRRWDGIRFVLACRKGHLDDVDWNYAVHMRTGGRCTSGRLPRYYEWIPRGSSLRDITVRCPSCGAEANVGRLYSKENWHCSGRLPEREPLKSPPQRGGCDENAIMILRQASNLRMPDIVTLFTVPPRYTRLHLLLETPAVKSMLVTLSEISNLPSTKEELEGYLNAQVRRGAVKEDTAVRILSHPWDEIRQAIIDILSARDTTGYGNLLLDEFKALIDASINGAPPYRSPALTSPVVFEVPKSGIRKITGPGGQKFRVVPITRLRTVIVQTGYRRIDVNAESVHISFTDRRTGEVWYPGTELLGEGIFIILDGDDGIHPQVNGDAWKAWKECHDNPSEKYQNAPFRERKSKDELHPVFVWWHTFSHLLLRVLSADSGYSSASLRERVYLEKTPEGVRGGIVIYTVQPGEGTMGGLISLSEKIESFIERAVEIAESCPNDPLCLEHGFACGKITGSACYACLFVSETSCEHRNMWLDRNIILEDPP